MGRLTLTSSKSVTADQNTHTHSQIERRYAMPIESLTDEQCAVLARNVYKLLVELWLDQNGIDAEVTIREVNHEK